jgi:hypothetical protein
MLDPLTPLGGCTEPFDQVEGAFVLTEPFGQMEWRSGRFKLTEPFGHELLIVIMEKRTPWLRKRMRRNCNEEEKGPVQPDRMGRLFAVANRAVCGLHSAQKRNERVLLQPNDV